MTDEMQKVEARSVYEMSRAYDSELRGGIGRGEIDEELAHILADWFNIKLASVRAETLRETQTAPCGCPCRGECK